MVFDGTTCRLEPRYLYLGIKWTLPSAAVNQQTTLHSCQHPPLPIKVNKPPDTPSPFTPENSKGKTLRCADNV